MEEKTVKRLWIAITAVVVAIAAVAFGTALGWSARVLLMPVILGIIIANLSVVLWVLWKKMQDKKAGFPVKDERTKIIEWRAGHYTVIISGWFMLGLMWYLWLGVKVFGLRELNAVQALLASIIVMGAVNIGLRGYFGRKGDIK